MRFAVVLLALTVFAAPAAADRATSERQFKAWIDELRPLALQAGVSARTFDANMNGLKLNWRLPGIARAGQPTGKSAPGQKEFASPGRYFQQSALNTLTATGRKMRARHGAVLKAIEARYGVPANILLAIWGRESAYGRAKIPHDGLRAVATLAFMGRRKALFKPEVIAALKILDQGHITRTGLKSSWAGAMGHIQMLPSSFLKYAVDFDGDGRRDIWKSVPDALATAANYLRAHGWKADRGWGFEVAIPDTLACTLEGPHQRTALADWTDRGARRTRQRQFHDRHKVLNVSLLLPAGVYGPAFLVTENFYVLKAYNESDVYALFVGHLADRISSNKPFAGAWRKVSGHSRAKVEHLQRALVAEGHDVGGVDGLIGFRTRVAVGAFQRKYGLTVDCWPGPVTFARAGKL